MEFRWRSSPFLAIFWLISVIAVVVMWGSLPSTAAQVGLICLVLLIIGTTLFHSMELPLIATVFFAILLVNDLTVNTAIPSLLGTILIFLILPSIGLLSELIGYQELKIRRSHWAMLGLLVAEANSLFFYWPVSFFNRTLLSGVVFYALWQLLRLSEDPTGRGYRNHFIFVGLTVMVVLGVIIWVNSRQLTGF